MNTFHWIRAFDGGRWANVYEGWNGADAETSAEPYIAKNEWVYDTSISDRPGDSWDTRLINNPDRYIADAAATVPVPPSGTPASWNPPQSVSAAPVLVAVALFFGVLLMKGRR